MTWRGKGAENGQAVVMAVVALGLFMMGVVGLDVDGAQIFAQQQMAQAAADAAAQAAIMSMTKGTNSTSTYPFSTSSSFTCTVPPAALDQRTPCVYAQDNGFGTSADTVIVSFPTTIKGVTLSSTPAVQVNIHRVINTGFMQFLGIASMMTVYAKGSAGILSSGGSSTCIYALGKTGNTFIDTAGGSLTTNCGFYTNGGMNVTAGGAITTTSNQYYGTFSGNSSKMTPAPTQAASYVTDPFASVPFPTFANSCTQTNYTAPAGALPAGTYCNGLTLHSGNFTLSGQYIINGGQLTINTGGTVSGSNVTFFITGQYGQTAAALSFSGGGAINLSAPSSGTYQGMLVYQDRNVTYAGANNISMGGASTTSGSWYFPTTELDYTGGGAQTGTGVYQAIVASTLKITGGGNLNFSADPTGQYTGLGHSSAGLVQ